MVLKPADLLQGRYRVELPLGQGGMGAVYRALDTRLNVLVAIKEMFPQPDLEATLLAELRQQFQQEALVLARLQHPNLVRVTDFFEEGGNVIKLGPRHRFSVNTQPLDQVLGGAGFDARRPALFVWEGVTYYLPPQAVEQTLAFIRQHAPAGSVLCFDYMITIPEMGDRFGAKQARDAMRAIYSEEPLQFDLAEDQVAAFLAERGFALLDHATPETLQGRYLTLRDGLLAGQMLDLFRLVQAAVVG